MADTSNSHSNQPLPAFQALKKHTLEHKLDMSMFFLRGAGILFTLVYFIPIFGNAYNAYYRVLLANAAVSAIRLHQRLPAPTISREFLASLMAEDSFHYLVFSLIFVYVQPVTLALLPAFLFPLVHFASYSLTVLDLLGQNSWWGARIMISLVEFQTRNILRLIAFTEIFLMLFVIMLLFLGRSSLMTPIFYFHFLNMRYTSRRNPHTRDMFRDLRTVVENFANKPSVPPVVRNIVTSAIQFLCRIAPQLQEVPSAAQ